MTIETKICGLTRASDMAAALDAGASMVGLVFFENSPRHLPLQQAAALSRQARGRAKSIVVTVDASDDFLDALMREVAPDMLQLHGSETPQRCADIAARCSLPLIKSVGIAAAGDIERIASYKDVAAYVLAERHYPKGEMPGGRGLSFDWSLLGGPRAASPRLMLSGGLDPSNVAQAIAMTRPQAVDVSSGVETAPGIKDAAKIRAFIEAARQ